MKRRDERGEIAESENETVVRSVCECYWLSNSCSCTQRLTPSWLIQLIQLIRLDKRACFRGIENRLWGLVECTRS